MNDPSTNRAPLTRASISLLTVCGIEELEQHSGRGVSHVLSILDPGTPDPESFKLFAPHHRTVLRFHDIIAPQPGMQMPTRADVEAVVAFGEELVEEAEGDGPPPHLLIHCHMGISRSTASMLAMLAAAYPDDSPDRLVERLVAIRPQAWPNIVMVGFLDDIVGRGGRLGEAVSRLHARQIARSPHLAETFRRLGRAEEVERAQAVAA